MATLAATQSTKQTSGQLTVSKMLLLHLFPGLVVTLIFILIAGLLAPFGVPASLALLLTWLLAGIPVLLGSLLYAGLQRNGRPSLAGVVTYREPLPLRQYLWLIPVLLFWTAISSTLAMPVAQALQGAFFSWVPDWLVLSTFAENLSRYSSPIVWSVVVLSFILNIAVPIVEEMYFRGYLLPYLESTGKWAPLLSAVLFSLYHFWLPWEFPTRIITLLPIIYVVRLKRNIYLSMVVHVLLNTIGSVALLALVLTSPS